MVVYQILVWHVDECFSAAYLGMGITAFRMWYHSCLASGPSPPSSLWLLTVFGNDQKLELKKTLKQPPYTLVWLIISSNLTSSNNSKDFRIYCSTLLPYQPVTYVYLWRHIQPITLEILYTFGWDLKLLLLCILLVLFFLLIMWLQMSWNFPRI